MGSGIQEFVGLKRLAVVGVSGAEKKFSRLMFRTLREKGYDVVPVNPRYESIDGLKCYDSIRAVPGGVEGAVFVTPKAQTVSVVRDVIEAGVRNVWIQQGAQTPEAERLCEEAGVNLISNRCILMFAEPTKFPHSAHRFILNILGKLPE